MSLFNYPSIQLFVNAQLQYYQFRIDDECNFAVDSADVVI